MGIVLKQTFRGVFYSYLGVILGGLNVAILFPILFSEEQVGLINIIITISAISAQFSSLGAAGITNYFFPSFRNKENGHNSFFIFISLYSSIGLLFFTVFFIFYGDLLVASKGAENPLSQQYYYLILPITIFTVGYNVLDMYSSSTFKSAIGNLFKDVLVRLIILVLCILYYFKIIDFKVFIVSYTLNLGIPVVGILLYLINQKEISFKFPNIKVYKPHLKRIFSVGMFYILNGLSDILASHIDKYMINYYLGLRATGIYSITNYFGTLARIPRSSMGKIGTPIIAKYLNENNKDELSKLIKKSSLSQILMGVYIFIVIWVNIDVILGVLPESYAEGKWVVFYISLSHIFYCFMGLGGVTIQMSKHYKYITVFTVVLGVSVVLFNLLLIPHYGINGAAMSTALAKFIFVLLVMIFVRVKMNIKVFFTQSLKIVLSGVVAVYLSMQMPDINTSYHLYISALVNVIIKSIIVTILYVTLLFATRYIKSFKQYRNLF